jgi:LmbE family N-acetylglucosaminyl deacetylase
MLGVWAHPDDEAYLTAGLMAEHRRRGDRVVVVTATLGEHGTGDPVEWPPRRLAERRHAELRASLGALGVDELRLLGYEDGRCPEEDGTPALTRLLLELDPDLVVTFGPDGMTGHPDHRAVSRWVTAAWAETPCGAALWYPTLTDEFHHRWGPLNEQVGLWADQPHPPRCTADALVRSTALPDDVLDLKLTALRAHASQTAPLIDVVGPAAYREWWRTESFRCATPRDIALSASRTPPRARASR